MQKFQLGLRQSDIGLGQSDIGMWHSDLGMRQSDVGMWQSEMVFGQSDLVPKGQRPGLYQPGASPQEKPPRHPKGLKARPIFLLHTRATTKAQHHMHFE